MVKLMVLLGYETLMVFGCKLMAKLSINGSIARNKAAKGAPRAYVFAKRIVWQKNASGLQAGALGERASASGASVA